MSEVEASTTSRFLDLAVGTDGLILAVSFGQIETVDRFLGPAGEPVEVRGATSFAKVRPDGTVLIERSDGGLEVLKLEGNALIERAWPVEQSALVTFHAGLGGVAPRGATIPEVIDLATGSRPVLGP